MCTTGVLLVAEAPSERVQSSASTPTSNPRRRARAPERGAGLTATRPTSLCGSRWGACWRRLSERRTAGASPPGGREAAGFDSPVARAHGAAPTTRGKVHGHAKGPNPAPQPALPAAARPPIRPFWPWQASRRAADHRSSTVWVPARPAGVTCALEELCALHLGQLCVPEGLSAICGPSGPSGARDQVLWGVTAGPGQPGGGSGWAATVAAVV